MGLYLSVPGADYSAAAGKIGTATLIASANDPLPVLALPGLVNWWSAEDAVLGSVMSWIDRAGGKVLLGANALASPSITSITANGIANPAVTFDGTNDYLDGDGSLALLTGYSMLYVVNSTYPAAAQLSNVGASSGQTGQMIYLWNDGGIRSAAQSGVAQVASTAAKVTSGAPTIVVAVYDGTQWKYAFNGVYDKAVAPASTGPGVSATTFRVGAAAHNANSKLTGSIQELMQFNGDLLSTSNATYYNWLIRRFKARYGIA